MLKMKGLKSLAFGLLGFSIAALALLLIYAVPEYIRPYFSAEAIDESQNFIFHYLKASPVSKEIKAYAAAREEDLADILKALSLKREAIPGKIHVFIHNSPAEMKSSIVKRKSAESTEIYLVVIDALYGEDPPAQLIELVSYFGLGLPSSRILKSGLKSYLTDPQDHYNYNYNYIQAAALPQQGFFTLQELVKLEAHGRFPQTLYEAFNSPKAKASLDLGLLSTLIKSDADISESAYPSPQTLQAESAALVKYLIEELGGIERFKRLWAAESLRDGVKDYGLTLEELDEKWESFLQEKRKDSALYNYLRGKNLASLGRYSEAMDLLKRALNTYPESGLILSSIYINLGKWEEAKASLHEALEVGIPSNNLLHLAESYSRWATYETEDLLIHHAGDSPVDISDFAAKSEEIFEDIREELQVAREALPEKIVIFIYDDEIQARKILGQDFKSWSDPLAGVIHLKYNQPVGYELASVISRYMLTSLTYSKVLQRGLAFYLDHSGRDYYKEAAVLAASEDWIPLRNLDFDVYDNELVRIEAAAMVGFLLERYGIAKFKELWRKTSLIAEYKSLESALEEIYGLSKDELEERLEEFLKLKR